MVFQNDGDSLKPTRDVGKVLQSLVENTFPGLDLEKELGKRAGYLEKNKQSTNYKDCIAAITAYK